MKVIVYTVAGVVVFGCAMVGWSIAGKLMSAPDNLSVVKGLLILAGLVGTGAAGAVGIVRWLSPSCAKEETAVKNKKCDD